jgi:hypothetical protein
MTGTTPTPFAIPLEWEERSGRKNLYDQWNAYTPLGNYYVVKLADEFGWYLDGRTGQHSATSLDEAKEAVQSDYETRVRSIIRPALLELADRLLGGRRETVSFDETEGGPTSATYVDEVPDFQPGDPAPDGYVERPEWARVQMEAGLEQSRCETCGLWKFPQEMCEQDAIKTCQTGDAE